MATSTTSTMAVALVNRTRHLPCEHQRTEARNRIGENSSEGGDKRAQIASSCFDS